VRTALEALYDAADDDSATAGPDMARGIFPVVAVADAAGARILAEDQVAPVVATMVAERMLRPDGGPASEGTPS
jgi:proteasome beta subunit